MTPVVFQGTGRALRVGKIVCVGRNYAEHVKEMNAPAAANPVLFLKPATALLAPGQPIRLPAFSENVHHEVELVAVVGGTLSNGDAAEAASVIAGYGVGLDLTARDHQQTAKEKRGPWAIAKGFDGSAPMSEIASAADVGDPGDLAIELRLNGEVRQSARTSAMLHSVAEALSYASAYFTFEPGDLLFTGTPAGVGPLRSGDRVEATIERVGSATWEVV